MASLLDIDQSQSHTQDIVLSKIFADFAIIMYTTYVYLFGDIQESTLYEMSNVPEKKVYLL